MVYIIYSEGLILGMLFRRALQVARRKITGTVTWAGEMSYKL